MISKPQMLVVRNFTNTAIELKLVERYASPSSPAAPQTISNFTSNIFSLYSKSACGAEALPKNRALAGNAKSSACQDVHVQVEPFSTAHTNIEVAGSGSDQIIRLTFEIEGGRYRYEAPTVSDRTAMLVAEEGSTSKQLTGVYIREESFLAIYSSSDLNSWMCHLDDQTHISALSIPGTHNSATYYKALPSVRCQAVDVRIQLDNGVRFLDIRVQPESPLDSSRDGLILVHGVFPISLTGNKYFRELVNEVQAFLTSNPTETVIMSIKREGPGTHTDAELSMILTEHYARAGDDRWFTEPRLPTLGEARGKIIILRRFALDDRLRGEREGKGIYLNAEKWAFNTPLDTHGEVCVQDFCEVLETKTIDHKIKVCCEHFDRASDQKNDHAGRAVRPLYLNFLSASNFWRAGCWPDRIAAKVNPAIIRHLTMNHDKDHTGSGSVGVVVCDWVGENGNWDLVRCIVGQNAKLTSESHVQKRMS